jgi:hypothetical protein
MMVLFASACGNAAVSISSQEGRYENSASLSEALNAADSVSKTILITTPQTLYGNVTIPASITLKIENGGSVNHGVYSLTIKGPFSCGLQKCFSGAGTVTFGSGSVREVYPEWWGAKGDGTTDDTQAIQAAIDSTRSSRQNPVRLNSGTYLFSSINIHSTTSLKGSGMRQTVMKAITSTLPFAFTIDKGPVIGVDIRDLEIHGNPANTGQGCFYFYAQAPDSGFNHGGLWYSSIVNITINGFSGNSIWLRGGATLFQHPNQFNTFENVFVFRTNDSTSRSLLFTGQGSQNTFINCEFDGIEMGVGTNIEISREFTNGAISGGFHVGGKANGDNAPSLNNFITCTSQTSDRAVYIDRGSANFYGCWFEGLRHAITVTTASLSTNITNSRFANACSDGSGTGYCISVGSTSLVTAKDNNVGGGVDKFIVGNSQYGIIQSGNFTTVSTNGLTSNTTSQLSDVSGVLNLYGHQSVLLNPTTNDISTVNSYLFGGDDILIRVHGPGYARFVSSGNISLPGNTPIVVRGGDTITLTRMDLGANWVAKAVVLQPLRSKAMPTSGTYWKGEFVSNSEPSILDGKILLGWTRLATGTTNVAGRDWLPCYATTN